MSLHNNKGFTFTIVDSFEDITSFLTTTLKIWKFSQNNWKWKGSSPSPSFCLHSAFLVKTKNASFSKNNGKCPFYFCIPILDIVDHQKFLPKQIPIVSSSLERFNTAIHLNRSHRNYTETTTKTLWAQALRSNSNRPHAKVTCVIALGLRHHVVNELFSERILLWFHG